MREIEGHVKEILRCIGEDPEREGLQKTPSRVARAWEYFTVGYRESAEEVINDAMFELPEVQGNEMVLVRNIEVYSLCEHHLVPFFGKCHVGYLPRNRILGLSKIARVVDVFARRLQVQERLTGQIAHSLMEALDPMGVGVVLDASHLCMRMRGVEKQNATARTSSLLGDFKQHATRAEFLILLGRAFPRR